MSGWCHGRINVSSGSLGLPWLWLLPSFAPCLRYLAMNSSDAKGIWMDSPEFRFRPRRLASATACRDGLRGLEGKAHFSCASIRKASQAQSLPGDRSRRTLVRMLAMLAPRYQAVMVFAQLVCMLEPQVVPPVQALKRFLKRRPAMTSLQRGS